MPVTIRNGEVIFIDRPKPPPVAAPAHGSGQMLDAAHGSVRRDELRATLLLFDDFRRHAPMKDLAEELNRHVAIYRAELHARDAIAKAQNGGDQLRMPGTKL